MSFTPLLYIAHRRLSLALYCIRLLTTIRYRGSPNGLFMGSHSNKKKHVHVYDPKKSYRNMLLLALHLKSNLTVRTCLSLYSFAVLFYVFVLFLKILYLTLRYQPIVEGC